MGVTELVVEERSDRARRKRGAHVVDLLAHLVPNIRHLFRREVLRQLDEHHAFAGLRVTAYGLEVRRLLKLALDLVDHLLLDFLRGGTRPLDLDHHDAERE